MKQNTTSLSTFYSLVLTLGFTIVVATFLLPYSVSAVTKCALRSENGNWGDNDYSDTCLEYTLYEGDQLSWTANDPFTKTSATECTVRNRARDYNYTQVGCQNLDTSGLAVGEYSFDLYHLGDAPNYYTGIYFEVVEALPVYILSDVSYDGETVSMNSTPPSSLDTPSYSLGLALYSGDYPDNTTEVVAPYFLCCTGANMYMGIAEMESLIDSAINEGDGDYWIAFGLSSIDDEWDDDVYYFPFTITDGQYVEPVEDTTTRIISHLPAGGSNLTASSTNVIGYTGYVNESAENVTVTFAFYNSYCLLGGLASEVQDTCKNGTSLYFSSGTIPADINGEQAIFYHETQDLTAGESFGNSTTTRGLPLGRYEIYTEIRQGSVCAFGYCLFHDTLYATSSVFTIDHATDMDLRLDQVREDRGQSPYATSTEARAVECGYNSFSLFGCLKDVLSVLFIPDDKTFEYMAKKMQTGVKTHYPLVIVFEFYDALKNSTPEALPQLSYTFSTTSPIVPAGLEGATLSFDIWGQMSSTTNVLLNTKSIGGNQESLSVYDIVMPTFNWLIWLTMFLIIVGELMGIELVGSVTENSIVKSTRLGYDKKTGEAQITSGFQVTQRKTPLHIKRGL